VPLGAVIDETGFEAGLDARDDGLVDVALALLLACGLDVEVDQLLAVDNGHPELFRLGGVEQHALHNCFPGAGPAGLEAGETVAARVARLYAIGRRATTKSTRPAARAKGRRDVAWPGIERARCGRLFRRGDAISGIGWASRMFKLYPHGFRRIETGVRETVRRADRQA
jgi:hypothetical protein